MTLLTGSTGNDTYLGAAGTGDIAVVNSLLSAATFAFDGLRWVVTSSVGVDTLVSVEQVQFQNATLGLVAGFGERLVNGYTSGNQAAASVASLGSGGHVVAWQSQNQDGSGYGIYLQRYAATGEKLGAETRVNTSLTYDQTDPSVAGLSGGGFVVLWETRFRDINFVDNYAINAQRFDSAGAKVGGETLVSASTVATPGSMEVAAVAGGGFVATWQTSDLRMAAQLFNSAGTKVGAELLLGTQAVNAGPQGVDVVALGSAGFVAVWSSSSAFNDVDVFQQRVGSNGVKIGAAVQVNTAAGNNGDPTVAALGNGDYVICWQGSGAQDSQGIFMQRYNSAGSKLGVETLVNGSAANVQASPSSVALSGGGFVVAWARSAGSGLDAGIYAQRFDSAGQPVGEQTRVSSANNYQVDHPEVAALGNGGFVVTWNSLGQDGSGSAYGVMSQTFNADGSAAMSQIVGDGGDNVITVTGSARVKLVGGAGNDSLTGAAGGDILAGGSGNDTLVGGAGNDTYTDAAGDVIVELVGGGTDTLEVAQTATLSSRTLENATLTGTAKADLIGNGANNVLRGNSADNVLNGGAGVDTLVGGAGNDTYVIDNPGELVTEAAGAGTDTVISSVSVVLASNVEMLRLGGGADSAGTGNALANLITGNAFANRLDGQDGIDTLIGGLGDDTYVVTAAARDVVMEVADEGSDTLEIDASWVLNSALDGIENLTLRNGGAYNGTGDGGANVIHGNQLDNLLDGKAGADTMDGGIGNDTYIVDNVGDVASELYPGGLNLVKASVTHTLSERLGGNLTLTGSSAISGTGNDSANVITGNGGANRLAGAGGPDTLWGGAGNDTLVSADGLDLLAGGAGNDRYEVAEEGDEVDEKAAEGTDTVVATVTRAFTLNVNIENLVLVGAHIDGHGNTAANNITGTAGNNLLDGGAGNDTLTGQAGDDSYLVDSTGDQVVEAASGGIDEVFSSMTLTLPTNVERLTLSGGAVIDGTGNTAANRLVGNDAANSLRGLDGADLLIGGAGNDRLDGGTGADTLQGGSGNDNYSVDSAGDLVSETGTATTEVDSVQSSLSWTLAANVENLTLTGSVALNGTGNGLRNVIVGNGGANLLNGAVGSDTLTGGAGSDTFRFDAALSASSNLDRITDFTVIDDTLQLENAVFKVFATTGAIVAGNLRQGAGAATAADSNDFLIYNTTTGALYCDADGSGAAAAVQFAVLPAGLTLTSADFLIA